MLTSIDVNFPSSFVSVPLKNKKRCLVLKILGCRGTAHPFFQLSQNNRAAAPNLVLRDLTAYRTLSCLYSVY